MPEATQAGRMGRPRRGSEKKQHVDITLSPEIIRALEQVTSNKSHFIEEVLRQHPEIAKHL
jgi:hypothetical protein